MHETIIPNIGDFVRVQVIKKPKSKAWTVSVFAGHVVREDNSAFGFTGWSQYQLDTGHWFSPQVDTVLEYKDERSSKK